MSGFRRVLLAFTVAVLAGAPALVSSSPPAAAATRAGQLSGVVRDDRGAPLYDATVWLTPTSGSGSVAAARTDGSGRYTLSAPAGTYDVRVAATLAGTRYGARVDDVSVDTASALDIVVVRMVRFSGTVRDGRGAPLKDVTVYLNGSGAGMKTAADGVFAVDVVPGTWPLVATLTTAEFGSVTASVENFNLTADRQENLVLPIRDFDVAVTDAAGQPKTSGSVTLFGGYQCDSGCGKDFELFPGGPASVGQQTSASLGLDGVAHLKGIDKPGNVARVSSFDQTDRWYALIQPIPHPAPPQVRVAFGTAATLQGTVRDSSGQPARMPGVSLSNAGSTTSSSQTGYDGTYTVKHPAGDYDLRLHASWPLGPQGVLIRGDEGSHNASVTLPRFNLPAGGRTQDFTVPGEPFTVKVVGADNQPRSGVSVHVASDGNIALAPGITGPLQRSSSLKTGTDGTVTAQIVPGDRSVSVTAYTTSNGTLGSSVHRVVDPAAGPVVLSMAGAGQPRVSGVVRDAAGAPISGLYVSLQGEGGGPSVMTNEGAYSAVAARPGRLTLAVTQSNYSAPPSDTLPGGMWWVQAPVDVSGDHTIDVSIPRAGPADVRLTTPDGKNRKGTVNVSAADVAVALGGNLQGTASTLGQTLKAEGAAVKPRLFGPTTASVRWYPGADNSMNPPSSTLAVSGIPLTPGAHLVVATAAPLSADPPPAAPPPTTTTTTTAPPATSDTTTTPANPPAPGDGGQTPVVRSANGSGYWMLGRDGKVYAFGEAQSYGDGPGAPPAVDLEPTPSGKGYWLIDEGGVVTARGDARSFGNVPGGVLAKGEKVTSLSATPTGNGYWIFTDRGRVVAFGDAGSFGDVSGTKLNGPVLDSVPTPSGKGYYMVASDGGIFAFGDAAFAGSMGGQRLNAPVQSLVPDGDGDGYWLVASDGGIFAFRAGFRGSLGSVRLAKPVTGMVRFGDGYLMVGEDGGIFNFSDRPFSGSLGGKPPLHPIVSVAALP